MYRIKNFEIQRPANDGDDQGILHCTFDYFCPLAIPGLAQIWNYLYNEEERGPLSNYDGIGTFEQRFDLGAPFVDPAQLTDALNGLQGGLVDLFELFNQLGLGGIGTMFAQLNVFINGIRTMPYNIGILGHPTNLRIKGKAAMGFEPWSVVRVAGGNDERSSGESEYDECLERLEQMQADYQEQEEKTQEICDEAEEKEQTFNEREDEYNTCRNDDDHPNNPSCTPQLNAMNSAEQDYLQKREECEDEGEILGDMNDEMANFSCP